MNTCYEVMLDRCRKDGRIVYYDHAIPMPRFIRDVDAFARGLVNLGLTKGDVITVYLPTCPQSVAAFLRMLEAGRYRQLLHR